MGFLIDTCIWVDVERGFLAPADIAGITGDEPVYLSPVTIAELKFGAEVAP
jgi:predicted nucleic acid-binding protein